MRKAGGIVAIIAGVFGVLAAILTLMIGGVGSAFETKDAGQVVWFGFGGIAFSFLVIVFGAVAIGAKDYGDVVDGALLARGYGDGGE
jgi:hypothetical protein